MVGATAGAIATAAIATAAIAMAATAAATAAVTAAAMVASARSCAALASCRGMGRAVTGTASGAVGSGTSAARPSTRAG